MNETKVLARAQTDYTIDGKSVASYQLCLHTSRGLKVVKCTKELFDTVIVCKPCIVLYDEYVRATSVKYV